MIVVILTTTSHIITYTVALVLKLKEMWHCKWICLKSTSGSEQSKKECVKKGKILFFSCFYLVNVHICPLGLVHPAQTVRGNDNGLKEPCLPDVINGRQLVWGDTLGIHKGPKLGKMIALHTAWNETPPPCIILYRHVLKDL